MINSRTIGYIAGLGASFFWGIHSVLIRKLTQDGVNPYLIAGLRLYIGIIILCLILNLQKVIWPRKKNTTNAKRQKFRLDYYFWFAAISLGINFLFFQAGLRYTLASDANLIQNFSPVAVLLLSSLAISHRIKEMAPTRKYWMEVFQIVLVGSIGASLVLINDVNNLIVPNHEKLFGDLLAFIGMIFFSLFVIFSSEFAKSYHHISSLRITMYMLAVAALPVTLFVPFQDIAKLTMGQWQWIIFIGIFSTGAAYYLWHIASKRLNVVPLTLNLVYIGIITVLMEVIFLDLLLDWKIIIGAIMMITASVLAEIMNYRVREVM